jgi:hypothetical protein
MLLFSFRAITNLVVFLGEDEIVSWREFMDGEWMVLPFTKV